MRSWLKGVRAKKFKRHLVILFVGLILTFIICNFTEAISESLIGDIYSTLGGKVFYRKIILDDSGVPITDYGYVDGVYIGKQRSPYAIHLKALDYYESYKKGKNNEKYKQLFLNCSDWLVNNSVPYDNYLILEYNFPWPKYDDINPPWRSGLAQGKALRVLIRAHNLTNDSKYLDCAKKLLNAFFVEVKNGGVTYKTSRDGWWYEEYAVEGGEESRVLNGMMFALLGIYEYYEYTEDDDAKYLFDQGVLALKKSLSNYDKNGYSYYDIHGRPLGQYQSIHVELLDRLYDITNEEIFKKYSDRWASYQESPFIIRLINNPTKIGFAIFFGNFFALLLTFLIIVFFIDQLQKIKQKGKSEK